MDSCATAARTRRPFESAASARPALARVTGVVILFVAVSCGAVAQGGVAPLPPEVARLHAATMARLSPNARAWIVERARAIAASSESHELVAALDGAVHERFSAASPADASAIAQLVLAEAYTLSGEQLQSQIERARAAAEARAITREYLSELRTEVMRTAALPASQPCTSDTCRRLMKGLTPVTASLRTAGISTISIGMMLRTVGDLRILATQLENAVAQLAELSARDERTMIAARGNRDRLLAAIGDYSARVSRIAGTY